MATLESIIGRPIHELSEDELMTFVENLRSVRQAHLDGAYDERKTRRTAAKKRKGPEITAEFLAEIDELSDDLDL